jgi:hypothetical protein
MPSSQQPTSATGTAIPAQWIGRDGLPMTCEEKIGLLNENIAEIQELCQHAFEEAMHMGCSEEFLRIVLQDLICSLKRTGKRPFSC